jgi:hypothetical protein
VQQAFDLAHAIGVLGKRQRVVIGSQKEIAPHASGQVDHHIRTAFTNPFHHLAIKLYPSAGLARIRFTYMDMCDRRTGPGCFDGGIGYLLGSDRNGRVFIHRITGTGDGATDDDISIHEHIMPTCSN